MIGVISMCKRDRRKLAFVFFICLGASLNNQRATGQAVVYIVRHAEKAGDSGDVDLSEQGAKRAVALAKLLKHANIKAIYTSDAKRTKQTAKPLAEQHNLTPVEIAGGNPTATADRIRNDHTKDAVLVVGHSNTVGPLIKTWAPDAEISIAANEHDAIFVVVPTGSGAGWVRLKYGAETVSP